MRRVRAVVASAYATPPPRVLRTRVPAGKAPIRRAEAFSEITTESRKNVASSGRRASIAKLLAAARPIISSAFSLTERGCPACIEKLLDHRLLPDGPGLCRGRLRLCRD